MTNPLYNGLLSVCKNHAAQFRQGLDLMEAGKMGTGELRDGIRVDTTQETIAQYYGYIADMELTIAKIEAAIAQGT